MHSIVTTFRGADIKVEVANFCAANDNLIDQDDCSVDMQQMSMGIGAMLAMWFKPSCEHSVAGSIGKMIMYDYRQQFFTCTMSDISSICHLEHYESWMSGK